MGGFKLKRVHLSVLDQDILNTSKLVSRDWW